MKTDKWKGNEGDSVTDFAGHHFGTIICIALYLTDLTKRKREILSQTSQTLYCMDIWNYDHREGGGREFVPYFTASFCLNILYYVAYGTKNEWGNVCNRFNCITRVTSPAGDGSNPSGAKHV